MIIFIHTSYEPYLENRVYLMGPANNTQVEMWVALFRKRVDTGFSTTIGKKPIAKFFEIGSQKEIEPRFWTPEMQNHAKALIDKNPVPDAGKKFTVLGKVTIGLAAGLLLSLISYVLYLSLLEAPQVNAEKDKFLAPPAAGDRYFGNFSRGEYIKAGSLQSGWIKVNSVNVADNMAEIQLSTDISAFTFDAEKRNHENFSGKKYAVTFKPDRKNMRVIFLSAKDDFEFTSTAYNNNFEKYKIPIVK